MSDTEPSAIRRAVEILGSQLALARALGITPVTVNQWIRPVGENSRPVPPKQCVRIEQITGGKVGRRDLRPHDWHELWPELEDSSKKQHSALSAQAFQATKTVAQSTQKAA